MTLKNQHLHGVIRHRLGHVPICDSICIQMEFVHGFQHCYFLKYIRTKRANDCYQVQLFSGVKCKHQLTRDLSAWLNKKTDVSHAECRNAREWEIELQTQGKSLLRAHLRFNGITLALYKCITFKNIAKIDL